MPALVLKQGLDLELGLDLCLGLDLEMLTEPEPMHVHRRRAEKVNWTRQAEIQLHIHWSTGAESWVSTIRGTIGASERGGPLGGPAGGGPRGGPAGGGPVHSPGNPAAPTSAPTTILGPLSTPKSTENTGPFVKMSFLWMFVDVCP